MTTKKTEQPKMVSVKLAYPHRHGGVLVPAGKTIEVTPDQAERIRKAEADRKLEDAAKAHVRMEAGGHVGNIVLKV